MTFRKLAFYLLVANLVPLNAGGPLATLAADDIDAPGKASLANDTADDGADAKESGVDLSNFSDSVTPGNNFYLYVNKAWLEQTEIPSDKSDYGIFTVLDDRTREQVRELVESAAESSAEPGTAAQKVGDLYRSVTDVETRNEAGIDPLKPVLEKIAAAGSHADLAAVMAELTRAGVYGPFAPYVSVDARDSERYTVYLTQAGLTMPDRDYYLDDEKRYEELREKLVDYIADMLGRVGHDAPKQAARNVFEIETAIAAGHWTKTRIVTPCGPTTANRPTMSRGR